MQTESEAFQVPVDWHVAEVTGVDGSWCVDRQATDQITVSELEDRVNFSQVTVEEAW